VESVAERRAPVARVRRRSRALRVVSWLLIASGALLLVWVVVVWQWQDPFTALYTHIEQHRLSRAYDRETRSYHPAVAAPKQVSAAAEQRAVAADARAYARTLHTGGPVGKLRIGRIGLNMVVVQGTDHESLKKGPGHYATSGLPGEGALIYVAGHRTTYLAPFADINDIRVGDYVTFTVPYGAFTYRVFRHYVVPANDVAALVNHGREILRLQACHPRFFATHRYLVDARLVSFTPRGTTRSFPAR
jgi:sortase A